ncbi:MAG: hypothetical protein PWQ10_112 [Patescibacteria group bacterium]|nr:hypothetical protein [Patescibacteria group bacterium]
MQAKMTAIRKRTQIENSNRTMFVWIAGVSVVFGFALVASIFLVQMITFNERVLQEKNNTVNTLALNNNNISELESQIRVLDTNQSLIGIKSNPDDQAIQVILDALPSDRNELALGASLQNVLLANIDGLTLESLQVNSKEDTLASESNSGNEIAFSFTVIGNQEVLKKVLTNLEKSIRTIDVIYMNVEGSGDQLTMTIQAKAFYEPTRVVKLEDKTVK